MRILVFGGTGEAIDLANALVRAGHDVTISLAGVTRKPRLPNGHIHRGGFGGVAGLKNYIAHHDFQLMIDATHAFAATMSQHIVAACNQLHKDHFRLIRQPWRAGPEDFWHSVENVAQAAASLPEGAHAMVTIGRQFVEPFVHRQKCTLILRAIEPPEMALPPNVTIILERPPFHLDGELALMRQHGITHLVTKNAGGDQTVAKLQAARQLDVQVIMIERPALPVAPEVFSVKDALKFVADHVDPAA